jgi:hypothetical protein
MPPIVDMATVGDLAVVIPPDQAVARDQSVAPELSLSGGGGCAFAAREPAAASALGLVAAVCALTLALRRRPE